MVATTKEISYKSLFEQSFIAQLDGFYGFFIDAKLAEAWLGFDILKVKNRKRVKGYAQKYARIMLAGQWMLNGECIKFSWDGDLLDGQHRLEGIMLADEQQPGIKIAMEVRFGLDSKVFSTMDTGKTRSAGDIFGINEVRYPELVAAATRVIWAYQSGYKDEDINASNKPTHLDYFKWYQRHTVLQDFAVAGQRHYSQSGGLLTPTLFTAFHYMFSLVDPGKADDFMHQLATGLNLVEPSSVWRLRRKLGEVSRTEMRLRKSVIKAYIILAWNAFYKGEDVKLNWNYNNDLPRISPDISHLL